MVMNLKALRARCEARLRDVEIPAPFDVWTFCGGLARQRRRPIVLRPIVSRLGPCGVWLALSTKDLILFE
jgi:hypothetical protein